MNIVTLKEEFLESMKSTGAGTLCAEPETDRMWMLYQYVEERLNNIETSAKLSSHAIVYLNRRLNPDKQAEEGG